MTEPDEIEAALQSVNWPAFVKDREWMSDIDSTGEKALWIWVVVSDTKRDDAEVSSAWDRLRQEIRDAISAKGIELWPYIRLKAESDREAPSKRP